MGKTDNTIDLMRQFIFGNFRVAKRQKIGDDDPLLESGIIDSLGILELVNFIEKQFAIEISDEDLVPENFQSISSVAAFVEQKAKG